jgi:low temperature requirement protein LtrA
VYFDFISHRLPLPGTLMVSQWFYLHLPLTMGIATVGAAVFNLVEHTGEHLHPDVRWLLVLAVAVTLISVAALTRTIQIDRIEQSIDHLARRVMLVSAALILLLGFTSLETIPLLIAVAALLLAPIFFALRFWLELLDQAD